MTSFRNSSNCNEMIGSMKGNFPHFFITNSGCRIEKDNELLSSDSTPRYVINGKSTYSLFTCLENGWTPCWSQKEVQNV